MRKKKLWYHKPDNTIFFVCYTEYKYYRHVIIVHIGKLAL